LYKLSQHNIIHKRTYKAFENVTPHSVRSVFCYFGFQTFKGIGNGDFLSFEILEMSISSRLHNKLISVSSIGEGGEWEGRKLLRFYWILYYIYIFYTL